MCSVQGQTGPKGESGTPGPPGPPVSQSPRLIIILNVFLCIRQYSLASIDIYIIFNLMSAPILSPHNRAHLAMLSTHFPSRLPLRAEHVGTLMLARFWMNHPWTPTTRTTTMAWRKSLARSTLSSWRLSR